MSYSEDLEIDQDALDREWLDQPRRYMKYARLSAKFERMVRHLEEKIKVLRSQITLEAKERSSKLTSIELESIYRTDSRHKEVKQELNSAQFKADLYRGAVFAFQQRKTALEMLVQLHGQSYFSSPTVPKGADGEQLKSAMEKRQSDRIKRKTNKEE